MRLKLNKVWQTLRTFDPLCPVTSIVSSPVINIRIVANHFKVVGTCVILDPSTVFLNPDPKSGHPFLRWTSIDSCRKEEEFNVEVFVSQKISVEWGSYTKNLDFICYLDFWRQVQCQLNFKINSYYIFATLPFQLPFRKENDEIMAVWSPFSSEQKSLMPVMPSSSLKFFSSLSTFQQRNSFLIN